MNRKIVTGAIADVVGMLYATFLMLTIGMSFWIREYPVITTMMIILSTVSVAILNSVDRNKKLEGDGNEKNSK